MVKRNLVSKKRGRPKGSKNKRVLLPAIVTAVTGCTFEHQLPPKEKQNNRYTLKSRVENNELDAAQEYHFIYDLNRGNIYPEIIARFTVETEAKLCTEFLNGIRKISRKEYEKKRICIL